MNDFNPRRSNRSQSRSNHPAEAQSRQPLGQQLRTPPTYPFLAYATVKEPKRQTTHRPHLVGQQAEFALLSTIPMQIGDDNRRDEPKQEKPSVSVNGDLGPGRRPVKQVFSPNRHGFCGTLSHGSDRRRAALHRWVHQRRGATLTQQSPCRGAVGIETLCHGLHHVAEGRSPCGSADRNVEVYRTPSAPATRIEAEPLRWFATGVMRDIA